MRGHGFLHAFPWATASVWADSFSDTALLYHLYLMPFAALADPAFGAKLAAVLLGAACFASFHAVLRLNKVGHARLWTLLLLCSGPYFLWRVGVTRPQALSVLLTLWTVHALLNDRLRLLAALCFLYPFSYAAAFLPLLFIGARAAHQLFWEGRADWRAPAAGTAAFALGMVLHPGFPDNLLMLWVQNFYVMGLSLADNVRLHMGQELRPMDTLNLVASHAPLFAAGLALSALGQDAPTRSGPKASLALAFALTAAAMTAVSQRFIEYSVPLAVLAMAFRADELLAAGALEAHFARFPARRAAAPAALALFFLVGGAASAWGARMRYRDTRPSPFAGAAAYLQAHVPPGETVFTCSWGDPPALLFHDDTHRYLLFLDPAFMVYRDDRVWRSWDDAARGRLGPATYGVIKDALRARTGVCEAGYLPLRAAVEADPRMKVVYDDGKAFVFRLSSPDSKIPGF